MGRSDVQKAGEQGRVALDGAALLVQTHPAKAAQLEAAARAGEGYDTVDWYFSTRQL